MPTTVSAMQDLEFNYQLDIIRYIISNKDVKVLVQDLEEDIFTYPELKLLFNCVKKYEAEFLVTPKKNSLVHYCKNLLCNNQTVDTDLHNEVYRLIELAYLPGESDDKYIFEKLVLFAKRQLTRKILIDVAGKIDSLTDSDYLKVILEMKKITNLGETAVQNVPGKYLFKDFSMDRIVSADVTPFFLRGINEMTSAGGFYPPQLVIFLASPKGFKTGTILSAAVDFAINKQKKVLYCDTENGIQSLTDRAYQAMVKCNFEELLSGRYDSRLQESSKIICSSGGEIRFEYFPSGISTLDDVENKIIDLQLDGFKPDIIIYDYFDKFNSSDKKISEKRLKIQQIYDHAIRLNVKYEMFALSVSQVKQNAVGKAVINMTDFAEDFGKAANCHAAFAICRTEYELNNGYAHLIPVAQRQGSRYLPGKECIVKIDESRMDITELFGADADNIRREIGITEDENTTNNRIINSPIFDE